MIAKLKKITSEIGFKRYFKNTVWVFGGKVLQIISAIFIGAWVARYLGPDQLGILSYSQSLIALFLALSTLGLNGILVRELVNRPEKKNVLLGTSLILQTCGSIFLMLLLVYFVYSFEENELTRKIIIILGSATFFDSFTVISLYFQSTVESKFTVRINIAVLLISAFVKILLILSKAPLIFFVFLILAESILTTIGLIWLYTNKGLTLFKWSFSKKIAKKLLKDSWPLILSGIIVSIYMKVDQIMIKEMMNTAYVGQYSAAVRLSEAWYFIPSVISTSLFPAIVNAKKRSEELYYERLQRLYDLMTLFSISIALPMTFLSGWLINILYGEAYFLSGDVLSLHIWAGVFVFLGVSREGWILSENLQRYTMVYLGLGMICNIILNLFLIPSYGIIGAAAATLIAQAVSVLIAPALFKSTRISFVMMIKSLTFYSIFSRIALNKEIK